MLAGRILSFHGSIQSHAMEAIKSPPGDQLDMDVLSNHLYRSNHLLVRIKIGLQIGKPPTSTSSPGRNIDQNPVQGVSLWTPNTSMSQSDRRHTWIERTSVAASTWLTHREKHSGSQIDRNGFQYMSSGDLLLKSIWGPIPLSTCSSGHLCLSCLEHLCPPSTD